MSDSEFNPNLSIENNNIEDESENNSNVSSESNEFDDIDLSDIKENQFNDDEHPIMETENETEN